MDRRAGAGDEDRVQIQIRGTLDERDDSRLGMRPDISQGTQAGEIVRSICHAVNRLAVKVGGLKMHRSTHRLREIGPQRFPVLRSRPIVDQADGDGLVGAVKRCAGQNTNCRQHCVPS